MPPSRPMAGELKMMSDVRCDQRSVPSWAMLYTRPSCEPITTEPSSAMVGDEVIDPPVGNVHQTAGFLAGNRKGERPRWLTPRRNMGSGGSLTGVGRGGAPAAGVAAVPAAVRTRPAPGGGGHRHWPASQIRCRRQSRSDPQGVFVVAHDAAIRAQSPTSTHARLNSNLTENFRGRTRRATPNSSLTMCPRVRQFGKPARPVSWCGSLLSWLNAFSALCDPSGAGDRRIGGLSQGQADAPGGRGGDAPRGGGRARAGDRGGGG